MSKENKQTVKAFGSRAKDTKTGETIKVKPKNTKEK